MAIAAPFPSVHGPHNAHRERAVRGTATVRRRRTSGRLTRRGRVVVALGTCVLAVAGLAITGPRADAATDRGPAVESVVVQAGESVWSIASGLVGGGDPRPLVDEIRRLNDLGTDGPIVGQTLLVPRVGD